jgi:hypothetical protein
MAQGLWATAAEAGVAAKAQPAICFPLSLAGYGADVHENSPS